MIIKDLSEQMIIDSLADYLNTIETERTKEREEEQGKSSQFPEGDQRQWERICKCIETKNTQRTAVNSNSLHFQKIALGL